MLNVSGYAGRCVDHIKSATTHERTGKRDQKSSFRHKSSKDPINTQAGRDAAVIYS